MKIREQVTVEHDHLVIKETHDAQATLDHAAALRGSGMTSFGESRCVGLVPMVLWREWAKDAGVRLEDTHAMKEVIRRKLLDGSFGRLRVWEGRY